jgi:hypothetical protein
MEREPLAQRMRQWVVGSRRPELVAAGAHPIALAISGSAPRPSQEGAGSPAEKRAYLARVEDAAELVEHGRQLTAIVLSRETSDRRFNGAQIIVVELEVEDPFASETPRTVYYEHVFGPATARRWKPGREIPIWIDPRDPERIYAGR